MSRRFSTIALALAAVLVAGSALAQQRAPTQAPMEPPGKKDLIEPPADPPKLRRGARTHNLDFLFGALKVAPDEASAKSIEDRIWAQWLVSGSDTCNLSHICIALLRGASQPNQQPCFLIRPRSKIPKLTDGVALLLQPSQ